MIRERMTREGGYGKGAREGGYGKGAREGGYGKGDTGRATREGGTMERGDTGRGDNLLDTQGVNLFILHIHRSITCVQNYVW